MRENGDGHILQNALGCSRGSSFGSCFTTCVCYFEVSYLPTTDRYCGNQDNTLEFHSERPTILTFKLSVSCCSGARVGGASLSKLQLRRRDSRLVSLNTSASAARSSPSSSIVRSSSSKLLD